MLSYLENTFAIALRLMLRLRPGSTAMMILLALVSGAICAGRVRSRKVRRIFLWALPLGAAALEILELLLVPLDRGGNWGLAAGFCAAIVALFWLSFATVSLIFWQKRKNDK